MKWICQYCGAQTSGEVCEYCGNIKTVNQKHSVNAQKKSTEGEHIYVAAFKCDGKRAVEDVKKYITKKLSWKVTNLTAQSKTSYFVPTVQSTRFDDIVAYEFLCDKSALPAVFSTKLTSRLSAIPKERYEFVNYTDGVSEEEELKRAENLILPIAISKVSFSDVDEFVKSGLCVYIPFWIVEGSCHQYHYTALVSAATKDNEKIRVHNIIFTDMDGNAIDKSEVEAKINRDRDEEQRQRNRKLEEERRQRNKQREAQRKTEEKQREKESQKWMIKFILSITAGVLIGAVIGYLFLKLMDFKYADWTSISVVCGIFGMGGGGIAFVIFCNND